MSVFKTALIAIVAIVAVKLLAGMVPFLSGFAKYL